MYTYDNPMYGTNTLSINGDGDLGNDSELEIAAEKLETKDAELHKDL